MKIRTTKEKTMTEENNESNGEISKTAWHAATNFAVAVKGKWKGDGINVKMDDVFGDVSHMVLKSKDKSEHICKARVRLAIDLAPPNSMKKDEVHESLATIPNAVLFEPEDVPEGKDYDFEMGSNDETGRAVIVSRIYVKDDEHPLLGDESEKDDFLNGYADGLKNFMNDSGIKIEFCSFS